MDKNWNVGRLIKHYEGKLRASRRYLNHHDNNARTEGEMKIVSETTAILSKLNEIKKLNGILDFVADSQAPGFDGLVMKNAERNLTFKSVPLNDAKTVHPQREGNWVLRQENCGL